MKFKFLTGDINFESYGGKFVSKKLNNGDWDYWLIIEVINWKNAVGEKEAPAKYGVSVQAVSPQAAGEEHLRKAFECCGFTEEIKNDPLVQVLALSDYGVEALLWSENGNNLSKLMKEARNQAIAIEGLFGFFMDRPMNRIGNTGWDFISGEIGFKYLEAGNAQPILE